MSTVRPFGYGCRVVKDPTQSPAFQEALRQIEEAAKKSLEKQKSHMERIRNAARYR